MLAAFKKHRNTPAVMTPEQQREAVTMLYDLARDEQVPWPVRLPIYKLLLQLDPAVVMGER